MREQIVQNIHTILKERLMNSECECEARHGQYYPPKEPSKISHIKR